MKRRRDQGSSRKTAGGIRLCPCPGQGLSPMVTFDPEDSYYVRDPGRGRGRRDPKRKPLVEKRYRVTFVDQDGHVYSIYVKARDEADAILAAERKTFPAGERIRSRWLKGFGWTPQVIED